MWRHIVAQITINVMLNTVPVISHAVEGLNPLRDVLLIAIKFLNKQE
jgi:hypothetical protein